MRINWFFRTALTAFAGTAALAGPITFTFTTTATGSFAGTPFNDAAVTVTSSADTSQVFAAGGTSPDLDYELIASSSTISIAGFATATFTDQTYWYDPNGAGDIEFGDVAAGTTILGLTHLFAGLETYNLTYSLGPVSSSFDFPTEAFNAFQNIPTSEGSLSLVASNDTFTAVGPAPEPASFFLAGLALLSVLALRRRLQLRSPVQHKR